MHRKLWITAAVVALMVLPYARWCSPPPKTAEAIRLYALDGGHIEMPDFATLPKPPQFMQ